MYINFKTKKAMMNILLSFLFILTLCFCVSGQDKKNYKIYSENCNEEDKCLVLVYGDAKQYKKAKMQKLAEDLSERYKDKTIVNVSIFDDEELIEAFMEGKRSPSQIQIDRRAYFIHDSNCGDLLFYKPKKNKIKIIKLSWKNINECNKQISI